MSTIHLDSGPRNPLPLCGGKGETTSEINDVSCEACYAEHDRVTCECSDEYGPCEEHYDVIAQREGASTRTADDLVYVFLTDVLAIAEDRGLISADMRGRVNVDKLREAIDYWSNDDLWDDNYGCRWVRDDVDAEIYDEIAIGESVLADLGLAVYWEDGYVISRVTGGPLVD